MPTMEEEMIKLMGLAEMAQLAALIKEKNCLAFFYLEPTFGLFA